MEWIRIRELRSGLTGLRIPPDDESMWLIKVLWLIREVRLSILLCPIDRFISHMHSVDVTSTTNWVEERQQVIELLGWEPHGNLPVHIDNPSMKILVYNCLGAGDEDFKRCMRESHRLHAAEVVAILEPRVLSFEHRNFFDQFGLTRAAFLEAEQQSGGIWLLWNPRRVGVTIIEADGLMVDAVISKLEFPAWVSTIVYGSPNPTNKDRLWGNLKFLLEQTGHPWTLAGGKLTHCASDDQRRSDTRRTRKFTHLIQCGLLGLGSSGLRLAWSNNTVGITNTSTPLHRALKSPEWHGISYSHPQSETY